MATFNKQMQKIFAEYEKTVSPDPANLRAVGQWAMDNGLWQPQPQDILKKFSEQMAAALREEHRVDSKGRSYRTKHAVRGTKNGKQYSLWADIDKAPRSHMQKAFAQRRGQIVGDCHQLRLDVDHYNDIKPDEAPINLVLDFRDDVEEMLILAGIEDAA